MKMAKKFMLYVGGAAMLVAVMGILFVYHNINSTIDDIRLGKNLSALSVSALLETKINEISLAAAIMLAIGLIVFFIQLAYISKKIAAPLSDAVDFSNKLARGDFSAKLPKGSYTNEIGELIRSLNFMRDRLQNSISKLQKSHMREALARKDAESANSMKSDFLANMSLELRNPLNSIMGFSSLILKEIENGSYDDGLKTKMQTVYESAETLNGLIMNLLELSKLDSSNVTLNISACDTAMLIRELTETNTPGTEEKNISLENHYSSDAPAFINTDRDMLFQILSILISTLINAAMPGKTISFGCKSTETKVIFWIKDSMSIDANAVSVANIYNKFVNAKSEQLPVGIGAILLNLTIAKTNAGLLNAELKASSQQGANSEFELIFNAEDVILTETKEISLTHTASNTQTKSRKNIQTQKIVSIGRSAQPPISILLAEDNEAGRMLLEMTLKNNISCTIKSVADGVECLNELSAGKYNILLLDLQMPNMDGHTVLKKLRQDRKFRELPIIVVSAYLENSDKAKIIMEGASACIIKPINIDELIATVQNFV